MADPIRQRVVEHFGSAPERITVTYAAPVRPTFGDLGWRDPDPAATEKMIELASAEIGRIVEEPDRG